jgi:pimeloyl-ACP methyl ester carboxylesterase
VARLHFHDTCRILMTGRQSCGIFEVWTFDARGVSALNQMTSLAAATLADWRDEAGRQLAELARRARLARVPGPQGVSGPPARLLLGEIGTLTARVRAVGGKPELAQARNPQPVMLLPGLFAHPRRMRPMLTALERAGHQVEDWGLGFNLGPTPENFEFLLRRLDRLARAYDAPVALVGWSLGGLFAREMASRKPHRVSRVITMGTPFSGDPRANNAWRAYQFATGRSVDDPPIALECVDKPPVPTIALWSPRDGVIAPRSAAGWPHERDRAVALRCTHLGFAGGPEAIAEVLRQLDLAD